MVVISGLVIALSTGTVVVASEPSVMVVRVAIRLVGFVVVRIDIVITEPSGRVVTTGIRVVELDVVVTSSEALVVLSTVSSDNVDVTTS